MDSSQQIFTVGTITGEAVALGNNSRISVNHVSPRRSGRQEPRPKPATVGIVTALPHEHAAMFSMLDGPVPEPRENDPANYWVGGMPSRDRQAPHTVVLTQAAKPGNTVAASTVANLLTGFPTVDLVLMVGTAAGVPRPLEPSKHVRLGDIVTAQWGIIDYDHVDVLPDGVRRRGDFPQPSALVTYAANALSSMEIFGKRPWEDRLSIAGGPDLSTFSRPADETDVLYSDDRSTGSIAHPDPGHSGHRAGLPKVHHGYIGSADRSFRNKRVRDALAAAYDLRAFEMEGTGIGNSAHLNGVEWFVVRGISDYGDGRTTHLWRPYASLVAAAYTHSLLGHCAPIAPRGGLSKASAAARDR